NVLSTRQLHFLNQAWPHIRPVVMSDGQISFNVEFSIPGMEERFNYQLALSQQMGEVAAEERLNFGDKCLFHQVAASRQQRRAPQWIVEPATLPPVPVGPIALGRIPSISEVVIAFTALTSGIGCYVFSDQVLRAGNQQQEQTTTGFDDTGTNFLTTLREIVSNLQDLKVRKSIVGALQRVNPSV